MDTKKIIKDSYPSSEKIYIPGKLFPIQVGMRKINLTDTVTVENGKRIHTPNAPVYVYDTSGPYTDPDITVDIDKGLPRLPTEPAVHSNFSFCKAAFSAS